jgi:hypothetical protein
LTVIEKRARSGLDVARHQADDGFVAVNRGQFNCQHVQALRESREHNSNQGSAGFAKSVH